MKLIDFSYTDLKGKQSTRKVLVVQEPSDKISGIDVSEASDQTVVEFALAYEAARQAFLAEVSALEKAYDLRYRFRQFFPSKMENAVTEVVE